MIRTTFQCTSAIGLYIVITLHYVLSCGIALQQRIWINNRSPCSTFCRWKLLQSLSPCVLSALPPPPATADHPRPPAVSPPPKHALEQIRTTERWAWASVIDLYIFSALQHRGQKYGPRQTGTAICFYGSRFAPFVILPCSSMNSKIWGDHNDSRRILFECFGSGSALNLPPGSGPVVWIQLLGD